MPACLTPKGDTNPTKVSTRLKTSEPVYNARESGDSFDMNMCGGCLIKCSTLLADKWGNEWIEMQGKQAV
jgi:hypothetical protein